VLRPEIAVSVNDTPGTQACRDAVLALVEVTLKRRRDPPRCSWGGIEAMVEKHAHVLHDGPAPRSEMRVRIYLPP
jgi:hypothetical protein